MFQIGVEKFKNLLPCLTRGAARGNGFRLHERVAHTGIDGDGMGDFGDLG